MNDKNQTGTADTGPEGRLIRILLADDHAMVRDGLKQLLAKKYPSATFGEASTTQEAMNLLNEADWDVMLLDLTMPGRGGLEVLTQAKEIRPKTKILVLTMHPADHYAVRVLKSGACGYVTKECASEEIVAAIEKVLAGGKYVTAAFAEKMFSHLANEAKKPHELLSDREYQVLRLLAIGKSVKEIGAELCLSIKTISTHRSHIFRKLDFKSNSDAVRYGISEGLTKLD
ncbi:MAG TPA: response regulator transcription factor [Verrucomicrobiae bacterium]|nr:response regulator transcription factor [Verrucomicrobiae bacterium]